MTCPGCSVEMTTMALDSHVGTPIAVDVCTACQAIWFDARESVQLSPASTLQLFRVIGEQTERPAPMSARSPRCPRCRTPLLPTHDRQRNTPFEYLRCERGHGRLVTFLDFLREKQFIRPLSAEQIEQLRRNVQEIHCANCGAPVDLASTSACVHCGSPLSMLDLAQVERVVRTLTAAAAPRPIRPELLLDLAKARREAESAFSTDQTGTAWGQQNAGEQTITAGLKAVLKLLKIE